MTPPPVAREIPQTQLIRKLRWPGCAQRTSRKLEHALSRATVKEPRHTRQIRHGHRMRAIHEPARHASPEAPAPEVPRRQSGRQHVVMNHEPRQVPPARARVEQSPIHFLVFTGKQPRVARRTQVLGVGPDTQQDVSTNDGIAAFEDAGEVSAEVALFAPTVDRTNHREIFGGQPVGRGGRPPWPIRAASELQRRILKRAIHLGVPADIDLFVVIDHADEVGARRRDTCVERARFPPPAFVDDLDPAAKARAHPLQQRAGAVGRSVVDDENSRREASRNGRVQQRLEGARQERGAVPRRNENVELKRR